MPKNSPSLGPQLLGCLGSARAAPCPRVPASLTGRVLVTARPRGVLLGPSCSPLLGPTLPPCRRPSGAAGPCGLSSSASCSSHLSPWSVVFCFECSLFRLSNKTIRFCKLWAACMGSPSPAHRGHDGVAAGGPVPAATEGAPGLPPALHSATREHPVLPGTDAARFCSQPLGSRQCQHHHSTFSPGTAPGPGSLGDLGAAAGTGTLLASPPVWDERSASCNAGGVLRRAFWPRAAPAQPQSHVPGLSRCQHRA